MRFLLQTCQDKLAFVQTYQIISGQCLVAGHHFKPDCFIRMHGQLSSTVINTVKMNHIKKDSRLTGLCTLGWALGMYSLIIFVVVKQEDLLDASLAILKKMKFVLLHIYI